ncbi:hypothetical protein AUJ17_03030 [Candidatus Micrarchaeota archaeon CG1_02_47_40]|nr:MAG: hypothetical protein AUJ17_03030 [Candidatus Micrarchaeota archaeon CG1_02_47_40]
MQKEGKRFAELETEENKKGFAELKTEENKRRERFAELENAIAGIEKLGNALAQKEKQTSGGQEKQGSAGAVYKKAIEEMGALEKKLIKEKTV